VAASQKFWMACAMRRKAHPCVKTVKKGAPAVRVGRGAPADGLSTEPDDVREPLVTLVRLLRWTRCEVQRRPLLRGLWKRRGKRTGGKPA
jgi:hypothetical protein